MRQASHDEESEAIGVQLARRRRLGASIFFALLLGFTSLLLGSMGVWLIIEKSIAPGPPWWFGLFPLVMSIGFLIGTISAVRRARTTISFHEHAAVKMRGRERLVLPYAAADEFSIRVTHNSLYFVVYAGSSVDFRLRDVEGVEIRYKGPFKANVKGLIRREYEYRDELETVKWAIAEQMADTMLDRMVNGQTLDWCGRATFTPAGLIIGWMPDRAVPYTEFAGMRWMNDWLGLYVGGKDDAVVTIPADQINFWPLFILFVRLAGWDAPTEHDDA